MGTDKGRTNCLGFIVCGWFLIGAALVLFAACSSTPAEIPNDLGAPELIQRAQEASDRNRYKVSLVYYETVLERFPDDMEYVCAAEYEIAFINYKHKNYEAAREGFNSLLARYDGQDSELLPQQFRILSNMILDKIGEIENRRKPAS